MNPFSFFIARGASFGAAAGLLLASLSFGRAQSAPLPTEPAYSVHVVGHGSPIYFLPGLGCSGDVWSDTVEALSATHECHVFTLAGFAGQPAVKGEFFPTVEAALSTYLKAHAASHPALVGHSLGGLLALHLAAENPGVVSRLVIIDSLPFFAGTMPGATPDGARQYALGLRTAIEQQPHETFLANTRKGLPSLVTTEAAQVLVFGWMEKSDQTTIAQAMSAVLAMDARSDVARVSCRLLLIEAGAGPGAVPSELYTQQYSGAKALSRVRIADAKHFVMLDQPDRFRAELNMFLSLQP